MAPAPAKRIQLLLHALQSPINVGSIPRVAETFATLVDIWDPPGLFQDEQKCRTISDFSCGAYARRAYRLLSHELEPAAGPARQVATCLRGDAVPLPEFAFADGDTIAIGNEWDGLPQDHIASAAQRSRVPMPQTFTPKPASFDPIDPPPSADRSDRRLAGAERCDERRDYLLCGVAWVCSAFVSHRRSTLPAAPNAWDWPAARA